MKTLTAMLIKGFLLVLLSVTFTPNTNAQLTAAFTATPVSGCPPLVVSFRDASTGNPNYWKWDLGNGTISYLQNPIATYFNPGTYNIKLLVRNAAGNADSIVKSQYITVNNTPTVNFAVSDTTGCYPLTVHFSDLSLAGTGTIATWQWDFGDGTISTQQNPTHTYTVAGNFDVKLRVVNSAGCSKTITKTGLIKLTSGVQAQFTYTSNGSCSSPVNVSFTNQSTGTGTLSYQWFFGDGGTSTLQNPTHNYTNAGSYTVQMIVRNTNGCVDTITKTNAINIGFVQANFTKPDTVCAGASFSITNTSVPATVSAAWVFSDGTTSNQINPTKTFNSAGVYTIKLVNNFGACSDSITKSITVLGKPTAAFTAINNAGCSVPLTVQFSSAASLGGVSYYWNFGDGTNSTLQNPTHTYTTVGSYDVSLTVINAAGCRDSITKNSFVKIIPPHIDNISSLPAFGCIPYAVHPVAQVTSTQPIVSYLWNFGDGTTSTLQNPTHTYTVEGLYNISLIITTANGCKDSLTFGGAVNVGHKPTANFGAIPTDVCAMNPVAFFDSTTNGIIHSWLWSFGDGGSSILQNPSHNYQSIGLFNVTLVVSNFGCFDTLVKPQYIHVKPPIAVYTYANSCIDKRKIVFTDQSIGAVTYYWTFGDGTSDTIANPVHQYATAGTYHVVLTVSNGSCSHTTQKDILVVDEHPQFTISDSVVCRNQTVTFNVTNVTATNISNYTWDFNDGSVTTTSNAPVGWSYSNAGVYNTNVVVTDVLGCKDTLQAPFPITVYGPKADFSTTVSGTCLQVPVVFNDSTRTDGIHALTNWVWNYGDSTITSYTASPFVHAYSNAGLYTITLTVTDTYGCVDSITKPNYFTSAKPIAQFGLTDSLICPGVSVTPIQQSSGINLNYVWNFGDGNISNAASPSNIYTQQGSYLIKLKVTDMFGCTDSTVAPHNIAVYLPKANFLLSDSFSTCPPLLVNITNNSLNYVGLQWSFGDGATSQLAAPSHLYTYPGVYPVKIIVTGNGGCIDTLVKNVSILGPTGTFTYNPIVGCNPVLANFVATAQNTVNFIWDYNDGTTVINTSNTSSHTFTNAGIYLPKLILEDAQGCRVPILGLDTIKVNGIETHIIPVSTAVCDSGYVSFRDSTLSNDVLQSWHWSFGDGATSTQQTPTHYYTQSGAYNVKLLVTTLFGCKDSTTISTPIKVVQSPLISITGDSAACTPASLVMHGNLLRADTSAIAWSWNFGNGQTANVQNPPAQIFTTAGGYTVQLSAANSSGCTTTVTKVATAYPLPLVDAGNDAIFCRFKPYNLLPTGAVSYVWDAHPTLSCSNCTSPIALPTINTIYKVTGTSAQGCVARDSVSITVQQPIKISVSKNDTLCLGKGSTLSASGASNYVWSPSTWLSSTTGASVNINPTSATGISYQVIGSDSNGCFKDTGRVQIKVYPTPQFDIVQSTATVNVGNTLKLQTTSSADVTKWKWTPALWIDNTNIAQPTITPKGDITYTCVAANAGSCVARDEIKINVVCNGGNVYLPNTFTPNGDGNNDVFYPRGKGLFNIKSLRIFNRWGEIIFEKLAFTANDPASGWDGTYKGNKVDADVYIFAIEVLCDNSAVIPVKGNVTLLR
jgi:gliding motility-associated-like protein